MLILKDVNTVQKHIRSLVMFGFAFITILAGLCLLAPSKVRASKWTEAQSFYDTYGNNAVFRSTSKKDGLIYCATKGNTSSSSTKYVTLGWRVKILDKEGSVIQSLYYKLGGDYMTLVNSSTDNGYSYALYCIKLTAIRGQLNNKALDALKTGQSSVILDACMTVSDAGKLRGTMKDGGYFSGKVYTSYKGISKAENWSSAALATLSTYYAKTVTGLFYSVNVAGDLGIETTKGTGRYCYGSKVTISAKAAYGYVFDRWKGKDNVNSESFSIYVTANMSYIACSQQKYVDVEYYRNSYEGDLELEKRKYLFEGYNQCLITCPWALSGYHMTGWTMIINHGSIRYFENQEISKEWIVENYSNTRLYASWEANTYKLIFEGQMVDNIVPIEVSYEDQIVLPENGGFLGWSLVPSTGENIYKAGESIKVKDIVEYYQLGHSQGAELRLYAIWESIPVIDACDLYFTIDDVRAGIKDTEIAKNFASYDSLDGTIPYGINQDNSFVIIDYDMKRLSELEDGESQSITLRTTNSAGKSIEKQINIYVADTSLRLDSSVIGEIRFISEEYYKSPVGDLKVNSIWKNREDYRRLLEDLLSKSPKGE